MSLQPRLRVCLLQARGKLPAFGVLNCRSRGAARRLGASWRTLAPRTCRRTTRMCAARHAMRFEWNVPLEISQCTGTPPEVLHSTASCWCRQLITLSSGLPVGLGIQRGGGAPRAPAPRGAAHPRRPHTRRGSTRCAQVGSELRWLTHFCLARSTLGRCCLGGPSSSQKASEILPLGSHA
jgi:hypothetical protein